MSADTPRSLAKRDSNAVKEPERLEGRWIGGTRVPVRGLFDHLEGGKSIEDFLEGFPSVKRE